MAISISSPLHGANAGSTSAATTSGAITLANGGAVAGQTIVVAVATVGTTSNPPTDSFGNTYVKLGSSATNTEEITFWGCVRSGGAVTTVTCTFGNSRWGVAITVYNGVLAFEQDNTTTNTGSASPATATLPHAFRFAGSWSIAAFANKGTATWSTSTGNLRDNIAGGGTTTPGVAIVDNTTTTCAAAESASNVWAGTIIEMLSTLAGFADDQDVQFDAASQKAVLATQGSYHSDEETQRALPPTPPEAIDQDGQELMFVGVRSIQYDDTDTQSDQQVIPPPPTPHVGLDDLDHWFKAIEQRSVYVEDDQIIAASQGTPPSGQWVFNSGTKNSGSISLGPSGTLAFSGPVAAGSLLVAFVVWNTNTGMVVSDNLNGSWIAGPSANNSTVNQTAGFFYFAGSGSGTPTVTFQLTSLSGSADVILMEYRGGALVTPQVDASNGASGLSTTPAAGNITTTGQGDLVLLGIAAQGQPTSTTPGGVWTNEVTFNGGVSSLVADNNNFSPQTIDGGGTISNLTNWWDCLTIAFFAQKAGGVFLQVPPVPLVEWKELEYSAGFDVRALQPDDTDSLFVATPPPVAPNIGLDDIESIFKPAEPYARQPEPEEFVTPNLSMRSISTAQLASDNFQRADENPLSDGGNWGACPSLSTSVQLQLVSDLVEATHVTNCGSSWAAIAWAPDHYHRCTIATLNASSTLYMFVRMTAQPQGSIAAFSGYELALNGPLGSSATYELSAVLPNSQINLSSGTIAINSGDVFELRAIGAEIFVYQNGVLIVSVGDTSITFGVPAVVCNPHLVVSAVQISAWSGGSVSSSAQPDQAFEEDLVGLIQASTFLGVDDPDATFPPTPPPVTPNIGLDDIEAAFKVLERVVPYDHTSETDEPGQLASPPTAQIDEISERFFGPVALQPEDETARVLPPSPPTVEIDEISERFTGPVALQPEDDSFSVTPTPPPTQVDDSGDRFSGPVALQPEDDSFSVTPTPPTVQVDEESGERFTGPIAFQPDDESFRSLPPTPPTVQQEEFVDQLYRDWRANQPDDESLITYPPTPPATFQEEPIEKNVDVRQVWHPDEETQRVFPPPPPTVDDTQLEKFSSIVAFPIEEDSRALPPTPPATIESDETSRFSVDTRAFDLDDPDSYFPPTPVIVPKMGWDDIELSTRMLGVVSLDPTEDFRALPPTPPFAEDAIHDFSLPRIVSFQYDDSDRPFPPTPPEVDDTQITMWGMIYGPALQPDAEEFGPAITPPPPRPGIIQDYPHLESPYNSEAGISWQPSLGGGGGTTSGF